MILLLALDSSLSSCIAVYTDTHTCTQIQTHTHTNTLPYTSLAHAHRGIMSPSSRKVDPLLCNYCVLVRIVCIYQQILRFYYCKLINPRKVHIIIIMFDDRNTFYTCCNCSIKYGRNGGIQRYRVSKKESMYNYIGKSCEGRRTVEG